MKITKISLTSALVAFLALALPVNAAKIATAPTNKVVLGALLKNLDVELSKSAHCNGVGVEQFDRTIGDYLSGFWAFHADTKGKNWLDISTTANSKGGYLAKVMIYRKDGEENWGWGVSFELNSSEKVDRKSFTCLGGG